MRLPAAARYVAGAHRARHTCAVSAGEWVSAWLSAGRRDPLPSGGGSAAAGRPKFEKNRDVYLHGGGLGFWQLKNFRRHKPLAGSASLSHA